MMFRARQICFAQMISLIVGLIAPALIAGVPVFSASPPARPTSSGTRSLTAVARPAARSSAARKPAGPVKAAGKTFAPVRDKWALVIGISKFQDGSINLQYAAKDARDFYNYLVTEGNFAEDHVRLLTDSEATRERILDELGDSWLPRVANPDDLVLIYISSHGSPSQADVAGVNYLVTHNTDKERLYATGIPVQELARIVKQRVHSHRVVMILDACHSGAATPEGKGIFRQSNFDAAEVAEGTGQMVICSSSPNQISWEGKDYQNGVFTRHLIKALRSKGKDTRLNEAFNDMKDEVQSEVLRERGQLQTPVLKSKWEGADLSLAVLPVHPTPGLSIRSSSSYGAGGAGARSASPGQGSSRPGVLWDTYIEQGSEALKQLHYSEAEGMFKAALAEAERAGDKRHISTSLNNLAAVCDAQRKFAEAEQLYYRALGIDEKEFGRDHPDVAMTLNNLSSLYFNSGKYAKAEPLCRRALTIMQQAHGSDHEKVAATLNTLASILLAEGRVADAEPLFEKAVSIYGADPGRNTTELSRTLGNLAELYRRQKKYAQAEALMKRALAIDQKALGPGHPDVAVTLTNLAANYVDQGDYPDAEVLARRALEIYEKAYGPEHREVGIALAGLAGIYHRQGKYAEAEPLYRRALVILERSGGGDNVGLTNALANYADLLRRTNRSGAAAAIDDKVMALRTQQSSGR